MRKKSLDYLKELSSIVTPMGLRSVTLPLFGKEKLDKFYSGIRQDSWETEEEVKRFFFGDQEVSNKSMQRLRVQLEEGLINAILMVGGSDFTNIQKEYREAWKLLAVAQILQGFGKRNGSVQLAEKALLIALKNQWLNIIVESARLLYIHYGRIDGQTKKFLKYLSILNEHEPSYTAERTVERYYTEIAHQFTMSRASNTELVEKAKAYSLEIEKHIAQFDNYKIALYGFQLFALVDQMRNDYPGVLKTCDRAIQHFKDNSKIASTRFIFSGLKIPCYLQLQEYQQAQTEIETCLQIAHKGTYNWMVILEYQTMLGFHSGNYQLSYQSLEMARPYFNLMPDNIQEEWHIIEGYILFFVETGKIKTTKVEKFKLGKFLNETPIFSKDKAGHNVNIIILQILYFLLRRRFKEIERREDSLKQYAYRYLKGDHTVRTKAFLKMLLQLSAGYFNQVATARKTRKFKKELEQTPIRWAMQASEIEIVPYETLWKMAMECL